MTILVTGATGNIGAQVTALLAGQDVAVRALTRTPDKTRLPPGVIAVKGELSDVDAMRAALNGMTTVFLLVPNVPDELTQALIALNLIREAGIERVVYLSVYKAADYTDVPHFAGKHTVERMIEACAIPATILRPAYYIQNDIRQKDPLTRAGLYAMPIGDAGVSMVDTRDIAEVAASELLRRERAAPQSREVIDLVGPDSLTGDALAALWSDILRRPIRYVGDDLEAMERTMKAFAPGWLAYDMRLMLRRYQQDGATATAHEVDKLQAALGHPPRSYRDFALEMARTWQAAD